MIRQRARDNMLWDIFCKVIDNHGDIGVCWRVAAQLASRGERVRLWVDDASALAWMAPQGEPGVEVHAWDRPLEAIEPGDVVIEAFGCELDAAVHAAIARKLAPPLWLNLEYLTAESFAQRNHLLASPVMHGPAKGLQKFFFYPGFTPATGGLAREADLSETQAAFDAHAWLAARRIRADDGQRISLFCYEPPALKELLASLAQGPVRSHLLVTAGRATKAVRAILARQPVLERSSHLALHFLPLMTQQDFDRLLWSCDFNLVRGEDSLVRALWAGKPFAWQIYPQHDDAHHGKLQAFLDWLQAPPSLREFHLAWNGVAGRLPALHLAQWNACTAAARDRLQAQDDLVTQLVRFALSERAR